jgi:hypothetical protein
MRKTAKFALTTIWILFSRSYDAYCTHQLTPDLSKEANPLVSVLGLGWAPLLLVIGALTLYTIYIYYLAVFKPKPLLPNEPGYSFGNVFVYLYLGRKDNWFALFYKLPNSFGRFNQYMGHVLTRCLVFAGVVSTTMWLLINHTDSYKTIHSAPLVYAILVSGIAIIVYQWSRQQYQLYIAQQ